MGTLIVGYFCRQMSGFIWYLTPLKVAGFIHIMLFKKYTSLIIAQTHSNLFLYKVKPIRRLKNEANYI